MPLSINPLMGNFLSGLIRSRRERSSTMQLAVKEDEKYLVDEDKFASAVHYTVTVETLNRAMTAGEREAIMAAVQGALTHLKIKIHFIMGRAPELVKVTAERTSSASGTTIIYPNTEASHD